jgi:hypothetical protein
MTRDCAATTGLADSLCTVCLLACSVSQQNHHHHQQQQQSPQLPHSACKAAQVLPNVSLSALALGMMLYAAAHAWQVVLRAT